MSTGTYLPILKIGGKVGNKRREMYKCSFCEAVTSSEKLPDGWGRAKLQIPGVEPVDVTFCPIHKAEAEKKLDLAFEQASKRRLSRE